MSSIGFRLITLGAVTLTDRTGHPEPTLARRRRKLAVLAVLAVARRPLERPQLAALFWGDENNWRARHSLADALSNLRRVLGPDAITTRLLEVSLSPSCQVGVDALELLDAVERRDQARVIELYGGRFLDGITIAASTELGQWVTEMRVRLHRHWTDACAHQCMALARGRRWADCAIVARRWLSVDPRSSDAALYLINAIKAPGTADAYRAAVDAYAAIEKRLGRDHAASPASEVQQLVAAVRAELAAHDSPDPAPKPIGGAPAPNVEPETEPESTFDSVRRRFARLRVFSLALVALVFLTATSFTSPGRLSGGPPDVRPVVAVLELRAATSDSATWVERSVPLLVTSEISRVPGVSAVAPDFVQRARDDLRLRDSRALTRRDVKRLGRRVGASCIATGVIERGREENVLDVSVHAVRGETSSVTFRVSNADLVALASDAAAKIAEVCRDIIS